MRDRRERNAEFIQSPFVNSIAVAVGVDGSGCDDHVITQSTLDRVLRALLSAMNDYTTDSRGDVGAW